MVNQDLIDTNEGETVAPCDVLGDGQEFAVEDWDTLPEEFCQWTWEDIRKAELAEELGTVVACCTDGFRPMVFEIERTG